MQADTVVDMGLELRYVEKNEHWLHRFRVSGVLFHVVPALWVSAFRLNQLPYRPRIS